LKLRYIIAQVVILILWVLDWLVRGASSSPRPLLDALLGTFLILFVIVGIPAIAVALTDGFAGRRQEGIVRQVLLSILVVGLAALVVRVSIGTLGFEDLWGVTGYDRPSISARIQSLISVEIVFLLEWIIAAWIRSYHSR
jgi:hypothetical protein